MGFATHVWAAAEIFHSLLVETARVHVKIVDVEVLHDTFGLDSAGASSKTVEVSPMHGADPFFVVPNLRRGEAFLQCDEILARNNVAGSNEQRLRLWSEVTRHKREKKQAKV